MQFFDTKEDVIDIQLTQIGKEMLSKGKFKPKFYSFSDDDVLYDVTYASGSENSYDAHQRIKSETIRIKNQSTYQGLETEIKRKFAPVINKSLDKIPPSLPSSVDARKSLSSILGNSDPFSVGSPSYEIYFAKAPLSASTRTDGILETQNIPQLEVDYTLHTKIGVIETNVLTPDINAETATNLDLNDYFFYEEEDYVFLDVKELNQLFQKENFDIDVYEYITEQDKQGNDVESLRPLKFMPTPEESLKYASEGFIALAYPDLTEEYVEYYFNINVDEEISDDILCQVNFENEKQDIFSDSLLEFECVETDERGLAGRRSVTGALTNADLPAVDYNIESPEDPC